MNDTIETLGIFAISGLDKCDAAWRMTQNCTADALQRHERVNAFNLVIT